MDKSLASLMTRFNELTGVPWFTIGTTPVTPGRLIGLVLILLLVWWISVAIERAVQRIARHRAGGSTALPGLYTLTRLARYAIWIVGSILGLNYIGFDLASLAIIGGAVGVGIGFGLQNIFSNFISGIIILLEKTLKVGDFVDLQSGVVGRVAEISMRYTRVTTNDSVDVIVPNSEFVNGRVINWTYDEQYRRIHVPFGVAYGTDKALVREAGIAAAKTIEWTVIDERRKPDVWLVKFGDSSLDFELVVWVGLEAVVAPGRSHARYLWAIEDELRKRGIEIPFPQRDLHFRSGTVKVSLDDGAGAPKAG